MAELWRLTPGSYAHPANIYDIRQDPAFLCLREVCRDAYPDSGPDGPDHALLKAVRSLGIPAGMPTELARLALPIAESAEKLDMALRAKEVQRVHLAPLDCAVHKLPSCSFGAARICHPTRDELSELMDLPRLKRFFGRESEFGMDKLSQFPWLVVEETVPIDSEPEARGGFWAGLGGPDARTLTKKDIGDFGGIDPHKSRYPKAFEDVLFFLLLAPWEDWTSRNFMWRPFSIPWVRTANKDIFSPLKLPRLPESLSWEPAVYDDEHGAKVEVQVPARYGNLDANGTSGLTGWASDDNWARVRRARKSVLFETPIVHFLLRGFETDGIDEFLAHITTIEASLGHIGDYRSRKGKKKMNATDRMGERISNLLGDEYRTKFLGLFDVRCKYVHGRKDLEHISRKDRRTARRLARLVVKALIDKGHDTRIESRENFLERLLDGDPGATG